MGTKRLGWLVFVCAVAFATSCSTIVNPDVSRLGGDEDGGQQPGFDAGQGDASVRRDGGVSDGGPTCPASCADSVACTTDHCSAGACIHTPNDGACAAGERCNAVMGCVPMRCTGDATCDDGVFCNGAETCDTASGDCLPGTPPSCADDASCTTDRCDAVTDACVHQPDHTACADDIGCSADACDPTSLGADASGCVHTANDAFCATDYCTTGGSCDVTSGCVGGTTRDCRDGDPCTSDSCDSVAGACAHPPRDDDGDGYPAARVFGGGGSITCAGGTDCNDGAGDVHPGAPEVCDGVDDDCNNVIDDGCASAPDDCGSVQAIPLDASGHGSVSGTFSSVSDDYQTNAVCMARTGGRDAVYSIPIPMGTWDVTIDTIGSSADTVLAVATDCSGAGFSGACNDDYGPSDVTHDSRMWVHRISSGFSPTTLSLLVDGYDGTETGGYQVNVQRTMAAGDSCPSGFGGTPLDISGGGTLVGYQSAYTGATRGSCQYTWDTSGEAVMFVRGPSNGNVRFDVYSADFTPDVYLRHSPCGSGTELDCQNATAVGGGFDGATLRESVTAGDPYYLFIDGGRGGYAVYYEPY